MNKIFKVIWNHATQMWIVVSELTKSHGKSTNQTDKRKSLKTTFIGITATGALLFTLPIFANTETLGGGTGNNTCNLSSNKDLACGDATTKAGGVRTNSGKGNIAIGVGSIAQSVNKNTADAGNIAIGHEVKAIGSASVAIGISTGNYKGSPTIAAGNNSYAIGNGATTGGEGTPPSENNGRKKFSIAPDVAANSGGPGAVGGIAIGSESWVMKSAWYGIAIGDNATSKGSSSMAYGRLAYAMGNNSISLGANTKAAGNQSIAIGGSSSNKYAAQASGESSISLGEQTNSSNAQSVAIGKKANSTGPQAIALGFESNAESKQSIAIGKGANASSNQSIAIGDNSKASHEQSIALGKSATAKASNAIAAGHNVTVSSTNAVALGNNINISNGFDNAVVLGSGSSTQNGEKHSKVVVNDITYSDFAGHDKVNNGDIVSIGNATHKRQLVNVAPGNVSATSTDAINGSQLYMVADTVADLAKATAAHLGGGSKLHNNNITAPSYALYKGTTESAKSGNGQSTLLGAPYSNVGAALTALNTYVNSGFKVLDNTNATKGIVTPEESIKFVDGTNTKSNVSQEENGITKISFNVENTDLSVTGGKVDSPANGDAHKFVNATTVANAINKASWKVGKETNASSINFDSADNEIKAGDEVRFADGKFTTISVGTKATNGKTTAAIKVDVNAQEVVEAAQTPIVYTDKQGNKVIKTQNGKFIRADKTNTSEIEPTEVIASLNSGSNTTTPTILTNVQSNLPSSTNNKSASIIPNNINNNNAATIGDVLNSGWNLKENDTAKDFVKHGDTINFKNGRGTKVTITTDHTSSIISFDTPLAYVTDNSNGIQSDAPTNTLKFFGGNNGAPVTLTNVNSGLNGQPLAKAATLTPNNAVNVRDLNDAISSYSFSLGGEKTGGEFEPLTTNNDEDRKIKKNETFMLKAGKNIKIKQIINGYEIATKDQLELGKDGAGGNDGSLDVKGTNGTSVKINGGDGSITLTGSPKNGQVAPTVKISTEKGEPTLDGNGPADRIVYHTNGKNHQVATMDDGLTFKGDTGTPSKNKLGSTVTIKGGETNTNKLSHGNNIGVDSDGKGNLTVRLAKELNLGSANNVNDGSIAGLKHNLPDPAQNTKQAAPIDLNAKNNNAATVGDVLNTGFNVRGATAKDGNLQDVDFVKPYDTLEFDKGEGTEVILTNTDNNKKTNIKVNIKADNTTIRVDPNTSQLTAITGNITTTDKPTGGKTFHTNAPNALATANTVMDVANKIMEEGLTFAGNTAATDIKRPLGTKLTIKGEKDNDTEVSGKNIHVEAKKDTNELLIKFSEKPEFKELKLAEQNKSTITLNTTGDENNPVLSFNTKGNKPVALKNIAEGTKTLNGDNRGDNAHTAIGNSPLETELRKVYNGLADLHGSSLTNAFTVADAKKLGWIVSTPGNNYAADVRNAHEVRFVGTNLASIKGETTDGVRKITVDVNAQKVVETAQIPVVYTDKTGKKLIKSTNNKFYPEGTQFDATGQPIGNNIQEIPTGDVIASMNSGNNATANSPTTLANVKGNLTEANNATASPALPDPLAKNNAATVGDVLNSGWNLLENGSEKDFVKHGDKVNFINGNGTKVTIDTANGINKIKFDTPIVYVNKGKPDDHASPSNEVKLIGENNNPVKLGNIASVIGTQSLSDAAATNPNYAVNVSDLNKVIGDFSFKLGGEASEGEFEKNNIENCDKGCIKKDETFKLNAGKNIKIKQIENGYEVATKDQITLGSKTANGKDGVNGSLTVTGKDGASVAVDGTDGSITLTGTEKNGHKPAVKIGTEKGKPTIDKTDPNGGINRIVYTTTENNQSKTRQVATMDDGLTFVGDTGPESPRKLGEKVTITGGETQDANLSNNKNIGVISDGVGKLTIKLAKHLNLSEPNDANNGKISGLAHNLTVSPQNNNANTSPININEHNAATVGDVLNAGWNLQANGMPKDFVKPYDTVNFTDGIGTTVEVKASDDSKTSTIKINTVMAYTDANGNIVKKAGDNKFYPVDANGNPDINKSAVENPQVNLVNAKDNKTTTPTQLGNVAAGTNTYANKTAADGSPLVKVGNKYYAPNQFTDGKLNTNAVETPLANGTDPTSNVTKAKSGLADLDHSAPTNVMTVADAKNMGWLVSADGNDYSKDVRNANEVKFIGGTGISVLGKDNKASNAREITIAIKEGDVVPSNEYTAEDGRILIKIGEDFYYKDDVDPTTGKAKPNANKVDKNIVNNAKNKGTGFVTGNKVADAIQKSYWTLAKANTDEIAKTTFNNNGNKPENINPNDNVRFSDGKNTRISLGTVEAIDPTGNKVTTTTVKFDVDSPIDFKYTDPATGKEYVKANNGKFYEKEAVNTDGSLKPVTPNTAEPQALTEEKVAQLHKGAQLINGLGKDGKPNGIYTTQDPISKAIEIAKAMPNATDEQIAEAKENAIKANPTAKDSITKGTGGVNLDNVAWAEKPDQAVNKDQLDQTVNKSGFFVKQNGTSTLTDDANKGSTEDAKTEKVTPNDVVDFVNGTNTSVTATTTRENGRDVTKVRVDVTGMPVTYTDKDGNKVAKVGDHYYKVDEKTGLPKVGTNGQPEPDSKVATGDIISSMVNPDGSTKKPTILSNLASGASTLDGAKDDQGNPLVKVGDNYYRKDQFDPTTGKLKQGEENKNVTPIAIDQTTSPFNGLASLENANPTNAMTVADARNLGWVVSTEDKYSDDVRNANEVKFTGSNGIQISGQTKGNIREINISLKTGEIVPTDVQDKQGNDLVKVDGKYYKADDIDANGKPKTGATEIPADNIVRKNNSGDGFVTGNQVGDAIQGSGFVVGKAKDIPAAAKFENKDERINPNDELRFSDGKNTNLKLATLEKVDASGKLMTVTTVKADVDLPIDFKYTDATGKEYVKANDGKFYEKEAVNTDGSLVNPATPPTALTPEEVAKLNKGAQLTNGSSNDGVANKAYEVKDSVQAAIQKAVADKLAENPKATSEEIAKAVDVARAEAIKANPEAKDKITQGTGGVPLNNVGWATQPDQAVNKDQLDQTVNKAGFFVKQNGESTIAGKDTEKVTPNDVVNFINGGNTVAKAETTRDEKTGQDRTDVSIHMTGLPVTYATKDGTPVTKVGDKFFKVNKDGYPIGDAVNVNELSTNLVNPAAPADKIGEPTVLGNVASGTNTIANKVDAKGNPLVQVGEGDTAKYYAPDQFDNGVLKADAKEAENPADATTPMHKAKGGLADLIHSNPNNALSVSDAKKLGFIVGAKDNDYADDVRNANVVEFVSGNDIATVTGETRKDGVREIKVTVSKNPVFETVQVGGKLGPKIGATQDGNIHIAKADGSPSRITNVAPGINRNDAVNLGQLDDKIGDVHKRINKLDKGMRAGVAGATAVAFLQRPNEAGKSLVSLGVGNFKGQSAVAVGYSRNSDNNKISIKLGSGFNTNGDVNIGGSIGYQW